MKQKPTRKNTHKEKIFTLNQNNKNYGYQKLHQEGFENKVHEVCNEQDSVYKAELRKKGLHVA